MTEKTDFSKNSILPVVALGWNGSFVAIARRSARKLFIPNTDGDGYNESKKFALREERSRF
ncbi:hypothetical protein ABEV74_01670 [Paenibacillus cisolokensis]|uniref:hypothetical protein n=1 Tax=Paenibacillus cisolokensis TaxID=1658519 RepID=UPI003D27E1B2